MIPMVSLRTEPFNLVYQDRVIIKILAHNLRGWSDAYPLNDESTAPKIQSEPLKMQPTTEGSATSRSVIEIKWDQIVPPNDGGSAILSYNLYWDRGNGNWINLVGQTSDYTSLKFSIGNLIVESGSYQFKVRARNRWGFGPFSNSMTIIASGSPYKIRNVTTYVEPVRGDVVI
jgi:hypothetical protein